MDSKYLGRLSIWGDAGRHPLAIELSQQAYGYLERLEQKGTEESTSFVRHALVEQKNLD